MSIHIILGDTHIGKGCILGRDSVGSTNTRIVDQINLLNWTLQQAVDRGAERIIITGDIFEDTQPHSSLIKMFIAWLNRCQDENIYVDVLYGNHDITRNGKIVSSALEIVAEAGLPMVSLHYENFTRYADGVCFTYMPFRDRRSFNLDTHDEAIKVLNDRLVYEASVIPDWCRKVLIGHLTLAGALYVGDEIADTSNELFCPLNMFAGYDYVWMGHIHRAQVMQKHPHIAHIGSMDLSNFGETDHEKIIVVIDTDSPTFFEEVRIPTRPLAKFVIPVPAETADTTQFAINFINSSDATFKNATVRVEIQLLAADLPSVDRKKIEELLLSKGVFYISGLTETKKVAFVRKKIETEITNLNDVSTAVVMYAKTFVDEKHQPAFLTLAESVIEESKSNSK